MKRTVLMGVVASCVLFAGPSAFALVDVDGTASAETIVIGYDSTGNDIIACVGSTETMITENSSTLSDDVRVDAGAGADTVKVLGSGDSSVSACSRTLTGSFSPNGKFIDVNGDTGNDTIRGGLLDGHLHGNADNDTIRLRDAFAGAGSRSVAFGDAGADFLGATDVAGSGVDMALDGGDGADCFTATASATGIYYYDLGDADGDVDIYDTNTSGSETLLNLSEGGATDDDQLDPSCNSVTTI